MEVLSQFLLFLDLPILSQDTVVTGEVNKNTNCVISPFPGIYFGVKLSFLLLLPAPPIYRLSQSNSSRDLKSVRELSLLIYRVEVCTEESSVMGFFAPWRDIT